MDIQEAKHLVQEENILSDNEVANIRIKLGKSHRSEKDWDYIKGLLREKRLFTIHPMDEKKLARYCFEGVLQEMGALLVFTNLEECLEYGKRHAAVRIGSSFNIGTIPFENVMDIATDHKKDVYIDKKLGHDERFLVYDGRTSTLHLCMDQRM